MSDYLRTSPVFTPAEQREMAEDPKCPPSVRDALLAGIATDWGDENLGQP